AFRQRHAALAVSIVPAEPAESRRDDIRSRLVRSDLVTGYRRAVLSLAAASGPAALRQKPSEVCRGVCISRANRAHGSDPERSSIRAGAPAAARARRRVGPGCSRGHDSPQPRSGLVYPPPRAVSVVIGRRDGGDPHLFPEMDKLEAHWHVRLYRHRNALRRGPALRPLVPGSAPQAVSELAMATLAGDGIILCVPDSYAVTLFFFHFLLLSPAIDS